MTARYIPSRVRKEVVDRARHRCQYCLVLEAVIGPLLEIDHVVPRSKGGTDDKSNLVAACPHCNSRKSNRVTAMDVESGVDVPLFNPLIENWDEHFAWQENGTEIVGLSAIGRATVNALEMNHPAMIAARAVWVAAGWHPPR